MKIISTSFLSKYLLIIALLLSPLYLFPSGLPQIGDLFFLFFSITMLLGKNKKTAINNNFSLTFMIMITWIIFISLFWSLYLNDFEPSKNAIFYLYNCLITLSVIIYLLRSKNHINILLKAINISIIFSLIGVISSISLNGRMVGFFNNPNQLAYYSLCSISLILIVNNCKLKIFSLSFLGFLSGVAGVIASVSLSALLGLIPVTISLLIANAINIKRLAILLLIMSATMTTVLIIDFNKDNIIMSNVENRLLERAESKIEAVREERNYERILAFPEYIIFGAAEGAVYRFPPYDSNEIHSSFGTMLFSYGFIGMGLFLYLLYYSIKKIEIHMLLVVIAPLTYSLTHQGLRTTLFWIFIGVAWYISHNKNQWPLNTLKPLTNRR